MFDVAALRRLCEEAAQCELSQLSDEECFAWTLEVEAARRMLHVAAGNGFVRLDDSAACEREFGLNVQQWVARETRQDMRGVHRRVGEAQRWRVLAHVKDALLDGRLSVDHSRVLTDACVDRVAERLAAVQHVVIDLASDLGFARWKAEVRGIVDLLDEDGGHDPNQDLARNQLTMTPTIDGLLHVKGILVGEHALLAQQALETMAAELRRQFVKDHEVDPEIAIPGAATLRALALIELCRRGQAVDVTSSRPPRPEVTLIVRAEEPTDVADPFGVPLQDKTTRRLLCDPDIFPIVVDSLGVPLDMGRNLRHASRAQRRATAARDGGCVFPGCGAPPSWCDQHHLDHWSRDGCTAVAVLVSLCRHHHGVTHRAGWQLFTTDDSWFWWRSPSGRTFWSQRHGRQRAGPTPARA